MVMTSNRRTTVSHICVWAHNLCIISMFYIFNTSPTIQFLSDKLICLNKLINFISKLIVLSRHNANMVVHRVYFWLHIAVVLMKGLVWVTSTFQFLSQVHQLVFSLSDFDFEFFDRAVKFDICYSFLIYTILQVTILLLVSLFKGFQML